MNLEVIDNDQNFQKDLIELKIELKNSIIETHELNNGDIIDTLKKGKFDYAYLLDNKENLKEIWAIPDLGKDIVDNIKEVVSQEINKYLQKYDANILFDRNSKENFKIGLNKTSLIVQVININVKQPNDLQSLMIFRDIDIFDLQNSINPFVVKNGDMVQYDTGFGIIKGILIIKKSPEIVIKYQDHGETNTVFGSYYDIISVVK